MALPKIEHKLYEHFLVGMNKSIKFRAFTVAEQKILLLTKEESRDKSSEETLKEVVDAVSQIVSNCTLNKIDPSTLCTFDLEDLFIRLRAKSVGETFNVKYAEHYEDEEGRKQTNFINVHINLDKVKVESDPDHKRTIMINEEIGLIMRYPTFKMLSECKTPDELAMACIETIFNGDEMFETSVQSKEEIENFYNSIEVQPLTEIHKFFDTMPKLKHVEEVTLHDGSKQKLVFEGLESFFS